MQWIYELHKTNPTAQAIAVISLVCVIGMGLGSIQVRGVKLGTSGVLFAAILFGHFTQPIDHHTLEFVKEFGLILFVFCLGMQLGPGFFSSLRRSGAKLNVLALSIVALGSGFAVVLGRQCKLEAGEILGLLSGAATNTPSLGAAQQTLATLPGVTADQAAMPALAYAVTYPVGILGIIASLLILKRWFRVDMAHELELYRAKEQRPAEPLERRTFVVENPALQGTAVGDIPQLAESGVILSRLRRANETEILIAGPQTRLQQGDTVLAVGTRQGLEHFESAVGQATQEDLMADAAGVRYQRIVVTNKDVLGKTVSELHLDSLYSTVVTRFTRGDVEMLAVPDLRLQFGDVLQIVGPSLGLEQAARHLGNSVQALNETHFLPLFAGIGLGILLGTLPIAFPGLPQPLRLGLAGGPLIVALLVGRLGRIGRLVWYMPRNANLAFREFGIALFFAAVGLMAGPTFFAAAFSTSGLLWLAIGACVTIGPLLIVGVFARSVLGTNFIVLSGLLAGSMTDPPALAFANGICGDETPAVAYATVYPLTMLLRIMAAQTLALILGG